MKTHVLDARPEPSESDIQKAAYFLWLELGRPAGRELETWLAAKELLRHRRSRASISAGRATPPAARQLTRVKISNLNP